MIHPFIEDRLVELKTIFKRHNVKKAYLFGSVCTPSFTESSDVDILIEPGDEIDPLVKGESLWNLYYELKGLLNRDIDMITKDSLTNKYFIQELDRTCIPIYG